MDSYSTSRAKQKDFPTNVLAHENVPLSAIYRMMWWRNLVIFVRTPKYDFEWRNSENASHKTMAVQDS